MARNAPPGSTAQQILDIATRLVQTRGFNAFSYADIAAELDVTKASLHYHYPTKAELGRALIERYEHAFAAALDDIDREAARARDRLRRYAEIYTGVLQTEKMCLCGMLAAEYGTLPEPMQRELKRFFDLNERWLVGVLDGGRERGELHFQGPAVDVARALVGSLEGTMMLARSYGDVARFVSGVGRLLSQLEPPSQPPAPRRGGTRRSAVPVKAAPRPSRRRP